LKIQKQLSAYHAAALAAHKNKNLPLPAVPTFDTGIDV
jgi:hypothetical protein